ncbi:unnamed protein product [Rotaria sp. Silwood1]|nr:unnamed protein product [Rotaria sp. Silwood1]
MSDNAETVTTNDNKTEKETSPSPSPSSSSFDNMNMSTPVRLFGQFKQNGTGFNNFGQLSSNGENASSSTTTTTTTTSYFTSTVSKLSSTISGGFGSSSTSLAASLAPLSSNKTLFGGSSNTTSSVLKNDRRNKDDDEEDEDDEEDKEDNDDDDDDDNNKTTPSLFETAAEYEAKRASTHPIVNIQGDTSTGEEHEVTKFQMAGKLYMYHPEQQQYAERGYGILKINESHDPSDWNKLHARLIMRLDKAFRVILNSPIFSQMTVERATDRSVRFGAQDESHLRIFVIKASANDCANLCKELQSRIQIIERQQSSSNINTAAKNDTNELDSSSTSNSINRIRKRSHSKNDSDTEDNTNDLSKKSKLIETYRDGNKDSSDDDDDSVESTKTGEQETNP